MHTRTKIHLSAASIAFMVIAIIAITQQGFAWTNPTANPPTGTPSITVSGGDVGIGTASPSAKLEVSGDALGGVLNDTVELQRIKGLNSNASYLDVRNIRTAAGGDWNSAATRIQNKIDATWMGYLQFNGAGNGGGISVGTGLTTTAPGNVGERMRINSAGNMGIGTTAPDANYRITTSGGGIKAENSSATQPAGYFNNAGGGPALTVGTGGITLNGSNLTSWPASGLGGSGTANYIPKFTAGATLGNSIVYDTGANVGIGTTSPARKLHIEGGGQISLMQSGSVATDSSAGLYWHSGTDYAIYRTPGAWTANTYQQLKLDWPTGIILDPGTGDNTGYDKSYVEITGGRGLMVTQGNVGIGTTNPLAKLSVGGNGLANYGIYGTGAVSGVYGAGSTGYGVFGYATSGTGVNGQSSSYRGVTGDSNTGTGGYFTSGSGYALVTGNGNVGIGVANPVVKMDVGATTNGNSAAFSGTVAIGSGMGSDSTNVNMLNIRSTTSGTTHSIASFTNSLNQQMFSMRDDGITYFGGKVGIGAATPASKLSVGGNGDANAGIYVEGSTNGLQAYGTNNGVVASGSWYGVSASATGGSGTGVFGTGPANGVYGTGPGNGVNGQSTANGYGVFGYSASGIGVFGSTNAAVGGYGLYGSNPAASGYGIYCNSGNVNGCGGNRAWYNSSDIRLKENIYTIGNALEKVNSLRGVEYTWKDDTQKRKQIGFIAQEVLPIVPEVVGEDTKGYYAMSYGSMVPLLVEAVKEQQKQIEQKQGVIDTLIKRIERLELLMR